MLNTHSNWFWAGVLAVTGLVIYLLLPVLMPFLVAAGLAYMGNPLVDRLQRWRLPRTLGVVVVFVFLLGILAAVAFFVVPALAHQLLHFTRNLPGYLQWIHDNLLPALGLSSVADQWDVETLRKALTVHWKEAGGMVAPVLQGITRSSLVFLGFLIDILIILVVAFYLLRDWDGLVTHVRDLLPRQWLPTTTRLVNEINEVLGAFVRGQLIVMLILAVLYSFGLWALGVDVALLIGTAAGLIEFVPYLGLTIGVLAASAAVLLQTHDPFQLIWVVLIFGGGNLLSDMLLKPWLVGHRIGLHPVAVIFALLAGGSLFGFTGILLALPVAAVIAVLARELRRRWVASSEYGGNDTAS